MPEYPSGAGLLVPKTGLLSARPTPGLVGQTYFATDDAGGTCYMCLDGATWTQIGKRGMLALASSSSLFTQTTGTATAVTGVTTTATVNLRPLVITVVGWADVYGAATVTNYCALLLYRDGSQISAYPLNQTQALTGGTNSHGYQAVSYVTEDAPSAGSHTYALYAETSGSSGQTLKLLGATTPTQLIVEEV